MGTLGLSEGQSIPALGAVPPAHPKLTAPRLLCNRPVTLSVSALNWPLVPLGGPTFPRWSSRVAIVFTSQPHTSPPCWLSWTVPCASASVRLFLLCLCQVVPAALAAHLPP